MFLLCFFFPRLIMDSIALKSMKFGMGNTKQTGRGMCLPDHVSLGTLNSKSFHSTKQFNDL